MKEAIEMPVRRKVSGGPRVSLPWVAALAGTGALAVAALSAGGGGMELDERAYRAMNGTGGVRTSAFFKAITELGSIWASAGATAALAKRGRKREALDAMGAAGTMWLIGQVLKKVYLRPRPYQALRHVRLLIGEPRGASWPSSHPAVLLAFLTVATRNLDTSASVRVAAAGLAGTVGLSRVYLGVHYPADAAGGLLLGLGLADLWSAVVSPATLAETAAGAVWRNGSPRATSPVQ